MKQPVSELFLMSIIKVLMIRASSWAGPTRVTGLNNIINLAPARIQLVYLAFYGASVIRKRGDSGDERSENF